MTVLITGGAGFIGSTLAHKLSAAGHSVRVLDDLSTGLAANLDGTDAELVVGSIADTPAVERCLPDVTTIVHLGARGSVPRSVADPVGSHIANVDGTLQILESARSAGAHVIFSSSSSVYGVNTVLPKREELWTQPMSPYGASKLAGESYCMAYRQVYGMDVLVFRFFNVYGPRQRADHDYAAVIPKFAWAIVRDAPIDGIHENPDDRINMRKVARLLTVTVDDQWLVSHDRPVNLAFGDRVTVNGIAAEVGRQLGRQLEIQHGDARPGDVRNSRNDPALLHSLFPDTARPVPFEEGVASVLSWMGE